MNNKKYYLPKVYIRNNLSLYLMTFYQDENYYRDNNGILYDAVNGIQDKSTNLLKSILKFGKIT